MEVSAEEDGEQMGGGPEEEEPEDLEFEDEKEEQVAEEEVEVATPAVAESTVGARVGKRIRRAPTRPGQSP